jgi:hypothetical protein
LSLPVPIVGLGFRIFLKRGEHSELCPYQSCQISPVSFSLIDRRFTVNHRIMKLTSSSITSNFTQTQHRGSKLKDRRHDHVDLVGPNTSQQHLPKLHVIQGNLCRYYLSRLLACLVVELFRKRTDRKDPTQEDPISFGRSRVGVKVSMMKQQSIVV